jgi:hypothetical protein
MVWRHGSVPGVRVFAIMLLASGFWSLTHLLEASVAAIEAKVFWSKVQYLGSTVVGPAWFLFTWHYRNHRQHIPARYPVLLAIIPIITVLLTWTNEAHHLIWTAIYPSSTVANSLIYEHGLWFWIAIAYNHSLVLLGMWNVIQVLRSTPGRNAHNRSPCCWGRSSPSPAISSTSSTSARSKALT